VILKSLYS